MNKDKRKTLYHYTPPELGGAPAPNVKTWWEQINAEWVANTRNDPALYRLYQGPLRFEDTGPTCRECVNFYYDKASKYGGRCRRYGWRTQHADTPATDRAKGWTHPVEGCHIQPWPACPEFQAKDRLSRR